MTKNFNKVKAGMLADPEVRAAYEALRSEYELARMITAYITEAKDRIKNQRG